MNCKKCNTENNYLIDGVCKKCYQKKHSTFFYRDSINKNKNKLYFQRNILTAREKICSVCGKTFLTKGRINNGKTCSVECRNKHYKLYHKRPEIKAKVKAYHLSHLKERQNYIKKVRDSNPCFKLAHNLRSNLRINLLKYYGSKKVSSFEKLVGYSYADLKLHLEKQFTPEMSWSNFGSFWEVDHIVPVSWFKTEEQLIKRGYCLSNLQPLEKVLNCSKQDKFVGCPVSRSVVFLLD